MDKRDGKLNCCAGWLAMADWPVVASRTQVRGNKVGTTNQAFDQSFAQALISFRVHQPYHEIVFNLRWLRIHSPRSRIPVILTSRTRHIGKDTWS